ncbi:hypothetical protein M406DRAFT_329070 [Cryphonectria parasitica EP155]|uniref:Uncharacterized protein n=1 Tax=Cryphonectria parasitica (strain ATCC 38755 / EP155) TaxID=660469 RepID=A0A9P4Y7R3_CRYP1|nr:uncharacterized protein M406DRAFT_331863 [Cryphonectria parasitica EP155]XP_040778986.1 uncharacterized protein M406DRAFT_329070 [Cryphonectria parasitica EP155]KAF3763339.1 hypothetical protein M406DRAFT_331863 [Cryphonectria parasitica EP155]KAF3768025.1 hypothetical protein M406DRAFT_329070 [Cryphonectria parasitica EP155]
MASREEETASQDNPFQAGDYHGNSSALFESPAAQRETGTLQHEDLEEPANFSNNPAFKEYIRYIKTQADDAKMAAVHANLEIRKTADAVARLETQQATIAIKQGALDTQVGRQTDMLAQLMRHFKLGPEATASDIRFQVSNGLNRSPTNCSLRRWRRRPW